MNTTSSCSTSRRITQRARCKIRSILKLGNAENIEVGTRVAVIGSPLGLEGTLSEGIVSAIRDLEILGGRWLQITAAVSPGSSGSRPR